MQKTVSPAELDARWKQVVSRDAAADDVFVYAVKTTGVYCRPSCPSRRAKPANVRFFAGPAEAEAAGFRPCLRCHPKGRSTVGANSDLIAEACRLMATSESMPTLAELAARIGLSPFYFHRIFKAETGLTPKAWAQAQRAERMRSELASDDATVTSAIYGAGYGSSSRFYDASNAVLGMTPATYRKRGAAERIRFAVAQCSLGALLVAQSDKGICAITLGDDPEQLVRDLQNRFSAAELIGDDRGFDSVVAEVVGFVEAPKIGLNLPLDIRGTAFQQRVWQALRQVPAGSTASYADIARQIGKPEAVRAVAGACAANAIAVAVPCHRIVRTDGGLSGYRWGVERKRDLLSREMGR